MSISVHLLPLTFSLDPLEGSFVSVLEVYDHFTNLRDVCQITPVTPERANFSIRLFLKSFKDFFLLPRCCFTEDQRHFHTSVKLFFKS